VISRIIRSEIILNWKVVLFYGALGVAMTATYALMLKNPGAIIAAAAILLPTQAVLLTRSSRYHADATECALPVSRDELILGKYLTVIATMLLAFVLVLATVIVVPHPEFATSDVLNPDRLATLVVLVGLISSLLVPLILRFGFMGIMVLILGLNVITVIVFVLTAARVIGNALHFVFHDVPAAVAAFRSSVGFPWFHLGALAVACGLSYASLKVSQLIYRRREL
jgi:hypothetical protein